MNDYYNWRTATVVAYANDTNLNILDKDDLLYLYTTLYRRWYQVPMSDKKADIIYNALSRVEKTLLKRIK